MDKKVKTNIYKEWLKLFPSLRAYAQNKLYKVIGAFVCGIELIKLPYSEAYRPHFVIYSLHKKGIKDCLDYPILMFEFFDDKNLQLSLPYDDSKQLFKVAQELILRRLKINLDMDISLSQFDGIINEYLFHDNAYKSHSGKRASLYELKLHAALYVGDQIQVQRLLTQILNESKTWNIKDFEMWYGKLDKWVSGLETLIADREGFLRQINENKKDKKIEKLQIAELIP